MKKIIAFVAIIASAQASAWWGNNSYNGQNNGYGYGNGYSNGVMDGAGDGWGRGYNQQAPAYYGYAPSGYAPAPAEAK